MILVFGSMNSDFFLNIKNFPMPGETVLTPGYTVKPGGKGANQAVAAAKAGAQVAFFGCAGQDEVAKIPLGAMERAGVNCSYVKRSSTPTGMAMIMVDASGENSIVVASGANEEVYADSVPDEAMQEGRLLVMQMEIPPEENFKLLRKAKDKQVKTLLNVAPAHPLPVDILSLVDFLVINEIEARMIYRELFESGVPEDIEQIVLSLSEKTGGICLVTLGAKGAAAAVNREIVRSSPLQISPIDTTGAGDAFVGIFAAMIDRGKSLADALRYASAGAGLACLKVGAQEALPTLSEIEMRISEIEIT